MECSDALPLIHEYLDGDLAPEPAAELQSHLRACADCAALLREYERTEALARMLERPATPQGLTASIMAALPPQPRDRAWTRWIRRHPAATAAAAFIVIMVSSVLSLWNQGSQLVVRGDDLEGIVIEGNKVIVPSDSRMEGDLVVENGTVQVDGDVEGDLVVIDGNVALASTAHISGRITQVDQAIDWIWYKISEWTGAFGPAASPSPAP